MFEMLDAFYKMDSQTLFELSSEFKQISDNLKELAKYRLRQEKTAVQTSLYIKRLYKNALMYALGRLRTIPEGYTEQQIKMAAHDKNIIKRKNKIQKRFLRIKVVKLAEKGYTNSEIAQKLHISTTTVSRCIQSAFRV
mgnify:CR=1 FL=1